VIRVGQHLLARAAIAPSQRQLTDLMTLICRPARTDVAPAFLTGRASAGSVAAARPAPQLAPIRLVGDRRCCCQSYPAIGGSNPLSVSSPVCRMCLGGSRRCSFPSRRNTAIATATRLARRSSRSRSSVAPSVWLEIDRAWLTAAHTPSDRPCDRVHHALSAPGNLSPRDPAYSQSMAVASLGAGRNLEKSGDRVREALDTPLRRVAVGRTADGVSEGRVGTRTGRPFLSHSPPR
jgi:hypothetical protein